MNRQLEIIADDYLLAGEVTPEDARLLQAALAAGGTEAADVHADLAFAVHLGRALDDDPEAYVRRIAEHIRETAPRLQSSWARQHRPALLAAAAGLAAGLGLGWLAAGRTDQPAAPAVVCSLAGDAVGVRLERQGSVNPATGGQELLSGDIISTSGPAAITYPDQARVLLNGRTRIRIIGGRGGIRLGLESGGISADLPAQVAGQDVQILTPLARLQTTTGASFQLVAVAERTWVTVDRGETWLSPCDNSTTTLVGTGGSAEIRAPAAGPTWAPLWPQAGLDGWISEYGSWRNQDGTMTGTAAAGGRARLLSVADFDNFELACQVRLNNPLQQGELQLSGYQWFVTLPASGNQWIDVAVIQQGSRIACQLNGASVEVHVGEPPPEPSRLLAFYLTGPGRIEIANARIRSLP